MATQTPQLGNAADPSSTWSTTAEVAAEADVVVVGAGPSGVCAAVSAAREGARVVLLDRHPFLGGTATAGLMAGFMGFYWRGEVRVTGGLGSEIVDRLKSADGGDEFIAYTLGELTGNPVTASVYPFEPEVLKLVLDDMVAAAKVEVIGHVQAADVLMDEHGPASVVYHGLRKTRTVKAARIIDATGDGLMVTRAGGILEATSSTTDRQPMTLLMRVSGVDRAEMRTIPKPERAEIVHEGVRAGQLFYETLAMYPILHSSDVFMLLSAVNGYDGMDERELTAAAVEGRRQGRVALPYLRKHMPGFANAKLVQTGSWMGIRETRRIQGLYTLTEDDVREGRQFPDAIAWGGGPLDTHVGHGVQLETPRRPFSTPYRCLVPKDVPNMLVVGRAASASRDAMSGLRHMGGLMPLGEAAGVAAASSVSSGTDLADVDVELVRSRLRDRGAIVDDPVTTPQMAS